MSSAALEPPFGERSAKTLTSKRESLPSEKVNEFPNVWDCLSTDVLFFIHPALDAWVCQSAKTPFPFPSLNPPFPETGPRLRYPRCWLSTSWVERLWRGPRGFFLGGDDNWYLLGAGGSRFIAPFVSAALWEGGMGETGETRGSVSPLGSRGAGRRGWVCLQGQQSRSHCRWSRVPNGDAKTTPASPLSPVSGGCLEKQPRQQKALWTVIVQRVSPSRRLLQGTARKNIVYDLGFFPFRSSRCKELDLKVVCYFSWNIFCSYCQLAPPPPQHGK